jgi:NADPH:quinone reductase-like Zn-dependent oxidoreductase
MTFATRFLGALVQVPQAGTFMTLKRVIGWGVLATVVALVAGLLIGHWTSSNACDATGFNDIPANPTKAIVYCEYGLSDVLQLKDLEKPTPQDGEILVKVRAAAVNPLDWHYMRGTPYVMRLSSGLGKPNDIRMGVDFAGTVESVGRNVTQFKPGDEVFGGRSGAFAEYVTVGAERAVALKPNGVSFEQAASVPIAAITALQALRDQGQLQAGQKVLINGASGGVGTFAVQIAKAMGAHVTGVCSTRNSDMVRSLGADAVVDYTRDDYTQGEQRYDLILDNVGNRKLSENRRILSANGRYVLVGGGGPDAGHWFGPMLKPLLAMVYSRFVSQDMGMLLAELNARDLGVLADLMTAGKVTPVIDRRYPLSQVPEAVRYVETGRARGKVIITID